jgi:hypothetical protein
MCSSASSVDFSGRGMYFIVSTFERNSSMRLASFYRHVLNTVVRFPDLERSEVYGQHYFCFIYWIRGFQY